MTYLAIDPGLDTGWALFADVDHLMACGLGHPSQADKALHVVIEKPKIHQARNMKGDPNDIITLAIQVGEYKQWALSSLRVHAELVTPHEWKGTQPKSVNNERTLAELSPRERSVVKEACFHVATSKQHNILDAIGLGRACFRRRLWR